MQPDCVMCEGTSECWIHSDFYRRIKANKSKLTDEQRTKFHNQVNELIDICGEVVVAGKKDLESYLSDEYVSKSEVDRLIREAYEECKELVLMKRDMFLTNTDLLLGAMHGEENPGDTAVAVRDRLRLEIRKDIEAKIESLSKHKEGKGSK